ncbi:CpsD/CapB family tyrosine-protein kinase [Enterococcus italicus]|uniref:CpsD/CapB family tyrosine-protein kinase n=1 Tax=Enterococcus italicus TaxID=246144 RepID=UPI003F47AE21
MAKKPKMNGQTHAVNLITMTNPASPISEQYRTIRTNIQFATAGNQKIKVLVVTSPGPREGKSTSSANLATVFAQSGQRVLLVDADMRKATVHKTFGLANASGLSTVLSTAATGENVIQRTTVPNLFVLTSGPKPPNPSELLGSPRMLQVIEELKNAYDLVIFDMPPIVAVTDAQIMASKADGTILVLRENISRKDEAQKAKELLQMVHANILGAIYNGVRTDKDQGYYYYYGN